MEPIRHFVLFLVSAVFIVTFSACGGGGSSGGTNSFVGTYSGSGSATLTGAGFSNFLPLTFTVIIDAAGNVTYTDSGGATLLGTITGNTFALVPTAAALLSSPSCIGTVTFAGTINGVSMVISISSTGVVCAGNSLTITGTLTGTRTESADKRTGPDQSWRDILPR